MPKLIQQKKSPEPCVTPVDPLVREGWKERLDAMKLGWGSDEYNIQLGSGPLEIPRQMHARFAGMGPTIRDFLATTRDLYLEDLISPQGTGFVAGLLESGLDEPDIEKQRDWLTQMDSRLPSLVRADIADFTKISELQIYMMGLGTAQSITDAMLAGESNFGSGLAKGFAAMVREVTGRQDPRILYLYSPFPGVDREGLYFMTKVEEELGEGSVSVAFGKTIGDASNYPQAGLIPPLDGFDLVYTNPNKAAVLEEQYQNIDELWRLYNTGGIRIEPPPETTIFNTKIAMALPFHPNTRGHYTDEMREIFPETVIVRPDVSFGLPSEEGVTPWERVHELPRSQRKWIIKSGRSGGSGRVFNLDCERKGVQARISQALAEAGQGVLWVAQRRVDEKLYVPFYAEDGQLSGKKLHSRTTPVYRIRDAGDCELLGGCSVFRDHWKVHGQPDAIIFGIKVSG